MEFSQVSRRKLGDLGCRVDCAHQPTGMGAGKGAGSGCGLVSGRCDHRRSGYRQAVAPEVDVEAWSRRLALSACMTGKGPGKPAKQMGSIR